VRVVKSQIHPEDRQVTAIEREGKRGKIKKMIFFLRDKAEYTPCQSLIV
jgi:hypothetical protein